MDNSSNSNEYGSQDDVTEGTIEESMVSEEESEYGSQYDETEDMIGEPVVSTEVIVRDGLMRRVFNGDESPEEAGKFLMELEDSFIYYGCPRNRRVEVAEEYLGIEPFRWWIGIKDVMETLSWGDMWNRFQEAFIYKYSPGLRRISGGESGESSGSNDREVLEIFGVIRVGKYPAFALFDTGSSYTLVADRFVEWTDLPKTKKEDPAGIVYADGGHSAIEWICEKCYIRVGRVETVTSLIVSPLKFCDVLIGMDWLSFTHANIDCSKKTIKFEIPDEGEYIYYSLGSEGPP